MFSCRSSPSGAVFLKLVLETREVFEYAWRQWQQEFAPLQLFRIGQITAGVSARPSSSRYKAAQIAASNQMTVTPCEV